MYNFTRSDIDNWGSSHVDVNSSQLTLFLLSFITKSG